MDWFSLHVSNFLLLLSEAHVIIDTIILFKKGVITSEELHYDGICDTTGSLDRL